ncbi:molybdopterin-binding protein [Thalassobius sp. Cn5-15]|uniref:molybdopterin-binding protein n=1 Tax=Thalassobius sp. Cn5-15 TaxID=2917763 RepID=UPI001EF33CF9|nr:molybdopterin-binding protein [Thalassobius sp. Cn5-15]MCG7492853.1 molybdopterin-binding protein [Thalassobius sp. Cn5-15]
MQFGPVPIHNAEGAILAHSLQVGGQRLRKGLVLDATHIAALATAGVAEVTVARLAADDLDEDTAATRIAAALVPDPAAVGLTLSTAFTGRVNVLAAGPGVVEMDVAALERLNAIDPMITVATVPPLQQMTAGGMVATIKIISYGVAAADVDRACDVGRDAMQLHPPVYQTAALIVTDIAGGAGLKGQAAIADRVTALGMALVDTIVVPHEQGALAEALAAVTADMALILTASATSDPHDVAPQALRQAGGQVTRFGMPVDPGNLLFLGGLSGTPVIGLPGCARSPALNGADWVLSRVACGVDVNGRDIAAMGVGGLLKEIPTRPMPRQSKRR